MNLFDCLADREMRSEPLADGAVVLRNFAALPETILCAGLEEVAARTPFRHMITPGGYRMSVEMTNCGLLGWVADRSGYRYDAKDPVSGLPWPAMPESFLSLAGRAAAEAGFNSFVPDSCLINRYAPGAKLSLHQDKDEGDFSQPIVSVSLGLPAVFQFGGLSRTDRTTRVALRHGDVAVWGGPSRLAYHAIAPLKPGLHPLLGACRVNLTFRKAG